MTGSGGALQHELALALVDRVPDQEAARVEDALEKVRRALRTSAHLRQVLLHPALGRARKTELLSSLGELPPPAAELLLAMCESRNLSLLGGVLREFGVLRAARAKEAPISVESAVELSDEEVDSIRSALVSALERPVRVRVRVRKDLLAGFRVRMGEKIIDGTAQGAFNRMERELTAS